MACPTYSDAKTADLVKGYLTYVRLERGPAGRSGRGEVGPAAGEPVARRRTAHRLPDRRRQLIDPRGYDGRPLQPAVVPASSTRATQEHLVTATVSPEKAGPETTPTSTRRGDRIFAGHRRGSPPSRSWLALAGGLRLPRDRGLAGLHGRSGDLRPVHVVRRYVWPLRPQHPPGRRRSRSSSRCRSRSGSRCSSRTTRRVGVAAVLAYVIDLLAAVPSVVFGLWGGRYLAAYLQPLHVWLHEHLGFLPFFGPGPPSPNGRSLLHRRHRAGDHDPADHHRDHPRGLRSRRRACTRRRRSHSAPPGGR